MVFLFVAFVGIEIITERAWAFKPIWKDPIWKPKDKRSIQDYLVEKKDAPREYWLSVGIHALIAVVGLILSMKTGF